MGALIRAAYSRQLLNLSPCGMDYVWLLQLFSALDLNGKPFVFPETIKYSTLLLGIAWLQMEALEQRSYDRFRTFIWVAVGVLGVPESGPAVRQAHWSIMSNRK